MLLSQKDSLVLEVFAFMAGFPVTALKKRKRFCPDCSFSMWETQSICTFISWVNSTATRWISCGFLFSLEEEGSFSLKKKKRGGMEMTQRVGVRALSTRAWSLISGTRHLPNTAKYGLKHYLPPQFVVEATLLYNILKVSGVHRWKSTCVCIMFSSPPKVQLHSSLYFDPFTLIYMPPFLFLLGNIDTDLAVLNLAIVLLN